MKRVVRKPRVRTTERKERKPFGVPRRKMNLDDDTMARLKKANRVPRWINDTGMRIQNALDGGYEFVLDTDAPIKTGDAQEVAEQDRKVKKQVGTQKNGDPLFAYLMAIQAKFYDEDQQTKEEVNAMVDQAIKAGHPRGLDNHNVNPAHGSSYVKGIDYKP